MQLSGSNEKISFIIYWPPSIYGSLNQFEKAEETIETMMKEVSNTEEYLYELAAFYLYDKKPEKAIEVYNRAEQLMGLNETSSLQKQKIYLEMGHVDDAIREGEKLVEAYPDDQRYVLELAEMLAENKLGTRAVTYIENYLKQNPNASGAETSAGQLVSRERTGTKIACVAE